MPAVKPIRKRSGAKRRLSLQWTPHSSGGLKLLQISALAKLPWLRHGFSTRPGGVSLLDGDPVLNLSFTDWDSRENVLENRRRFQSALGAADLPLVTLKQIHSDVIHVCDCAPSESCRGDALTTNRPGIVLAVQTAVCVPVLLVDP
jgi:copper oxidase (laccase) domain-containing protein